MPRKISSPEYGQLPKKVVPISIGGTNATTPEEAADNLGAVRLSKYGMPGGPAPLDANSQLRDQNVPLSSDVQSVDVAGLTSLFVSQSTSYVITDYDYSTTYTLSAISGTVSRNGETISYTAPAVAGTGGFTLNGKTYDIVIKAPEVVQPTIVSPVNESTGIMDKPTLTSSTFLTVGGTDTHASSDWQIATDVDFTNIVASISGSSTSKISWTSTALTANTLYYMRVRYNGTTFGASAWSPVSSFTTKTNYYPTAEQAILTASDKAAYDYFGQSVSVNHNGTICAIGAIGHSVGGIAAGAVYIYTYSNGVWTQQAMLSASDKVAGDRFGASVALSLDGTTCVVGANVHPSGGLTASGSAYVFTCNTSGVWSQQAILTASDKAANNYFGIAVAISTDGDTCVIGAYGRNSGGLLLSGAAYVFTRSGAVWTQQAILTASDKAASDTFGWSVAIGPDGNTCAIGAYTRDSGGLESSGAVYIFTRSDITWTQQAILTASDKAANDRFGHRVTLGDNANICAVSANQRNSDGITLSGAVYVFTRSGTVWAQQTILTASDKAASDTFGSSVSLSSDGKTCAIGVYVRDTAPVFNNGAVYIFTYVDNNWSQKTILLASDRSDNDSLGSSLSLSNDGGCCIASTPYRYSGGIAQSGAAYVFN